MIELTQSFTFEAAHYLPTAPDGHANNRIHGHSFKVEITVAGDIKDNGILIHFDDFSEICHRLVKNRLDHHLLNEIEGFENPTLENMCKQIYCLLRNELDCIKSVAILRETCGQKCVYYIPGFVLSKPSV